jgi:nicotinamide mononucleotide transporter
MCYLKIKSIGLWERKAAAMNEWLQWIGLIFGVIQVLLARANKIALYPAGIISSAITIYLFWNSRLYAESLLNLYYVIMSIYGWWHWIHKKNEPPVDISFTARRDWIIVALIVAFGYGLLYLILNKYTNSDVPHWDAWVTSTAWAGTWLLAKRKVENWILLNISNAFAIPLLFHKQLPMYAWLTVFLFIVAVQGYFAWRKKAHINKNEVNFLQ